MRFRSVLAAALIAALSLGGALPALAAGQLQQTTISTTCATYTGCPAGSVLNTTLSPPQLVSIQVSGTFNGTLQFEGSLDCATYTPIPMAPAAGGVGVSSTNAAGLWSGIVINPTCFQVRATSWTAGTATVTMLIGAQASGGANTVTNFPATTTVIQGTGANLHMICDSGCSSTSAAWTYYPVPASALCVSAPCIIKGSAATLGGIMNISTSAQPVGSGNNCTIYDSTATAAGQILLQENGIGPGQIGTVGAANGMAALNGLVLQCLTNPTGNGLLILFK